MLIKNPGMPDTELNFRGTILKSDSRGVFDVSADIAEQLLATRGWSKPRETIELVTAYENYKRDELAAKRYSARFEESRQALSAAQIQADRGGGTPVEGSPPAQAAAAPPPAPPTARVAPVAAVEAAEDAEAAPQADPAAGRAIIARVGREPDMRWKLDDLIAYAQAMGVSAETGWTKAQIMSEIETAHDME
jgi:hypothetical protein